MNFLLRWLVCAVAVAAAAWIVPGFSLGLNTETWVAVALLALVLTLLDHSVKPLLQIISLPVTVLTLGLFYVLVNTAVLYLAAAITTGLFNVTIIFLSFGSALAASIIISLVSVLTSGIVGVKN